MVSSPQPWQTTLTPLLAQFQQVAEQALSTTYLGALPGDNLVLSSANPTAPAGTLPAPAAAQPTPAPAPTYTVKAGDSLIEIAKGQLGNGMRWQEIWDLNRSQLPNPNEITPGQVLKMPAGSAPNPTPAPTPTPAPAPGPVTPGKNLPRATIEAMLDQAADQYGIPRDILKGVAMHESSWQQWEADGSVKAGRNSGSTDWGIMQINDYAHPDAFPRVKTDLAYNIDYGAQYLASQYKRYGNWQDAIAAYNAGSVRRTGSGQYANAQYVVAVLQDSRQFGGGPGFSAVA
jgi:soluble lytic murein transglycosylase-like protein